MCDGVENIAGLPNLNTDGLRVRSEVAKALNLPLDLVPIESNNLVSFKQIESNETEFNSELQSVNDADIVYYNSVAYISDLHLLHRFFANHCESTEDREYVLRRIMESFLEDSSNICLIGGDVASDYSVYQSFVSHLSDSRHSNTKYFFTLGNHEFWSFPNNELKATISDYRSLLAQNGMYLVQNNLYYLPCTSSKEKPSWLEITECELETISAVELRERTKGSSLIIFGGVGFAGNSTTFNANQGIYRGALDREQEIKECEKFNELHKKVSRALPDQNVIVFTHMPVEDWSFDQMTTDGFIYVNGHRHINRYYDDGQKRLYADNQIGYTRKDISLKHFSVQMRYDLFSNVSDGIHVITANEYRLFHRSIGKGMDYNRDFSKIHMLKREHHYMFLAENSAGELYLLSGGQITKLQPHPLEYYYERMLTYVESVRLFTADYRAFQSRVSDEVERLGGIGVIHGCIIDLDWSNHLYVNPIDGTITPYYADSVVDKYIYKNIPSLLKAKMPDLYQRYVEQIEQSDAEASFPILYNQNQVISTDSVYEPDTSMYRVSWILRRLQELLDEKIILIWNDYIADRPSKEIGRTITKGLIEKK